MSTCASCRAAFAALLLTAFAAMSGCASRGDGAAVRPMQGDFMITVERADGVPPGTIFLKPIPGRLLGRSIDRELFRSEPGRDVIRVSADALAAGMDGYARLGESDVSNPGELANPRDLGIARIGAFFEPLVETAGCGNFSTGLGAKNPANAMLVYVDRAGSVQGVRYTPPYIMNYQLEFPAPGIYVIAFRSEKMVVTQHMVDLATSLHATVRRAPCT